MAEICPFCGEPRMWPVVVCRVCGRRFGAETSAGRVLAVRLGPDGSSSAALTSDGMLFTWTPASGTSVRALPVDGGQVVAAAIAGDLEGVVYAVDKDHGVAQDVVRVVQRDGAVGQFVGPLPAPVLTLDVSAQGDVAVVACLDGTAHWLPMRTGRFDGSVVVGCEVNAIAIMDDGVAIASCIDGGLRRIDVRTGAVTRLGDAPHTTSVAVTPDGSSAVTGRTNGSVVVHRNLAAGVLDDRSIANDASAVRAVALSSDADHILVAAHNGTVRLHSLRSGFIQDLTWLVRASSTDPKARSADRLPPSRLDEVDDEAYDATQIVDDDVQFTVYRPSVLPIAKSQPLLVFTHKSDAWVEPDRGLVRPLDEVKARARAQFGDLETRTQSVDAQQALLRGNVLQIVPDLPGLLCDPAAVTVLWRGPVHEARFLLWAPPQLAGSVVAGWIRVWC